MIIKEKERLTERLNNYLEIIPETVEGLKHIPNSIDGHLYTVTDPGELRISIIYDPKKYLDARRKIAKHWQYKGRAFNERIGSYFVYFRHRELQVKLSLELEISPEFENGASCRLVEVGHKTEIIYGLECK